MAEAVVNEGQNEHEEWLRDDADKLLQQLEKKEIDRETYLQILVKGRLRLENLADHDYLTGLLSTRGIGTLADKIIDLDRRHGRKTSLIMMDLDNFKAVNDKYGHDVGDQVLKSVAEVLDKDLNEGNTSYVARVGGEELVVLVPDIGADALQALAQSIGRAIPRKTGQIEKLTAQGGITVSVGAVEIKDETFKEALARADANLYVAKENRNRAVVDNGGKEPQIVSF